MDVLSSIPVRLEAKGIAPRFRLDPARAGGVGLEDLVALAVRLIAPRAVVETAFAEKKGEASVEIAGVTLTSLVLRRNLDRAIKVFPYILTIGPELEREAAAQGDLLRQYYLEEIANIALEQAAAWLAGHLEARSGLGGLSTMSPGSLEDWPLSEQARLFSIFGDTESPIGVRLNENMLMVPRKSISGIFFPSEEGFVACRLCDREKCPSRKAPFDAWRTPR